MERTLDYGLTYEDEIKVLQIEFSLSPILAKVLWLLTNRIMVSTIALEGTEDMPGLTTNARVVIHRLRALLAEKDEELLIHTRVHSGYWMDKAARQKIAKLIETKAKEFGITPSDSGVGSAVASGR